jgi:hypothetical protein
VSTRRHPVSIEEKVAWIEEQLRAVQVQVVTTAITTDHGLLDGLEDDDHTQYQLRDEKGAVGGYAGLDGSGVVPDDQLPGDLVRTGDAQDGELLAWLSMGMAS